MADCCSAPGLLPFQQALEKMLSSIKPVTDVERIEIEQGLDRVLASDVISPINVPGHNNSAMDGYAFCYDTWHQVETLTVVGRSMAGAPFQGECLPGQCVRIMTGAKMPSGCNTVEMQENCQVDGDKVSFGAPKKRGANVRLAGEDIAENSQVFKAGRKLSVVDLGVLSSLGIKHIEVYRKLTVAVLATGDELKSPGETLTDGDIYESNSHVITALLERLNINVLNLGIIEDSEAAIKAAFEQADQEADAVISSGGVSVGDADYTKLVLDELGQVNFWKIAMKPGKPFAFGQLANSIFFGLPGNPVSAMVTAHLLAVPALQKLQNSDEQSTPLLKAKTTCTLRKSPGRMDFQRGIVSTNADGELVVTTTGSQGSGILTSMAQANCYIVLEANQGWVDEGQFVQVKLFDKYVN